MKRFKNILILFIILFFAFICISDSIQLDCIFKSIFGINCPACGLTRSFRALLKLDIISSFKYNIFGPILFIIVLVFLFLLIKDIIKNEDNTINITYRICGKYYYIIIICLIISMFINNIRSI